MAFVEDSLRLAILIRERADELRVSPWVGGAAFLHAHFVASEALIGSPHPVLYPSWSIIAEFEDPAIAADRTCPNDPTRHERFCHPSS